MGDLAYYGTIVLFMALESSFFPFPSEVVMPPAGYLASKGELSLFWVIFSGILGSVIGALFNYYISYKWGRPMVLNLGARFGLKASHLEKVERFFSEHGEITTFVGRLIPGVRQYISLPAGLGRMNLFRFVVYTGIGAGIWVTILALIGFYVGENEAVVKEWLIRFYPWIVVCAVGLIGGYLWLKKRSVRECKR